MATLYYRIQLFLTLSLWRPTIVGPQLITWSLFALLQCKFASKSYWSWKDLCLSKQKLVPSGNYDALSEIQERLVGRKGFSCAEAY